MSRISGTSRLAPGWMRSDGLVLSLAFMPLLFLPNFGGQPFPRAQVESEEANSSTTLEEFIYHVLSICRVCEEGGWPSAPQEKSPELLGPSVFLSLFA